ncbi:MAG: IPT/TIG domain-containing protein [Bacteriovoracaceae bacterium]|nr:IPT/TIG domain-containing protein [Bacteriovoracaceae bacterium]
MKKYFFLFVMLALLSSCQENPLGSNPKAGPNFHPGLNAPPRITSISPNQGAYIGGTNITLTGDGFQLGITVKIGNTNCSQITYHSATRVVCLTPAHTMGPKDIYVENKDKQNFSLASAYTYITNVSGTPGFGVGSGGQQAASASMRLNTTIGEALNSKVMTGATMQMRVGVQGILFED